LQSYVVVWKKEKYKGIVSRAISTVMPFGVLNNSREETMLIHTNIFLLINNENWTYLSLEDSTMNLFVTMIEMDGYKYALLISNENWTYLSLEDNTLNLFVTMIVVVKNVTPGKS